FTTSTSQPLTQNVLIPTMTTLNAAPNPTVFGQSVIFTATVSGLSSSGTPTGTVTFKDGTTTLGVATLNSAAIPVATFTTSALSAGSHAITAVYNGDTTFAPGTSGVVTQAVNQASTTTTLSPSINPSAAGQAVTFTAIVSAVSPGAGTPTGMVTFQDGTTTLGTGTLDAIGRATFQTSSLTQGSHTVTATYQGEANFLTSTSSAVT